MLLDQRLIVPRHDARQERRGIARTLVCQRLHIADHLHRREAVQALPDDSLQNVRAVPAGLVARVVGLFRLGVRALAGVLKQLDARVLAEAEGLRHNIKRILARLTVIGVVGQAARFIEIVVAGLGQCLLHIDGAVRRVRACPHVALRREVFLRVVHVDALVRNLIVFTDVAHVDGRDGRDHLVDRAGGIFREQRPVVERLIGVLAQLLEIAVIGGKIISRIARAGEDLACLHGLHHDGPALGVLAFAVRADAVFAEVQNQSLQRILCHGLERDVQRRLHVVARLRDAGVVFVELFARGRDGRILHAARPVQIFLKGQLDALFADLCVHRVALVAVFRPVPSLDAADGTEQMRRVLRVVDAHGARFDNHARNTQLHHRRKILRADVGRQRVVFQPHALDAPQLQLIPDGDDLVRLLLRPVTGDVIILAQLFHQRRGRRVEVIFPVAQECAEIILPCGRDAVHLIGIRPLHCYREMAFIFDAALVAEVEQLQQVFVRRARVGEDEVDDHEVIARAVRDEDVAVPVEDVAARGLHRGAVGHRVRVCGHEFRRL